MCDVCEEKQMESVQRARVAFVVLFICHIGLKKYQVIFDKHVATWQSRTRFNLNFI